MNGIPDDPTSVTAAAIGARAMNVTWMHSGSFGGAVNGFNITITSTSEGEQNTVVEGTADGDARSFIAVGLVPFRYNSSNGVSFTASVRAFSRSLLIIDFSQNVSIASPVLLPREYSNNAVCVCV